MTTRRLPHVRIVGRGAGVAIVYLRDRYIGRVTRIGTAWAAWRPRPDDVDEFIGWGASRAEACALLYAAPRARTR